MSNTNNSHEEKQSGSEITRDSVIPAEMASANRFVFPERLE